MINLLPQDVKKSIGFARRNTKLLKWSLAFLFGIAGIGVVVVAGLFYINRSVTTYAAEVDKAQNSLKAQNLDQTQKKVQDISNSFKLSVQVLSKEILFSKLIQQIGAAMPANASLTNLTITDIQGGIDLTAIAKDYVTATQVQVNLQDPNNKIFDNADIQNITCSSANTLVQQYPCTVNIRAHFKSNNPYLFINTKPGAQ